MPVPTATKFALGWMCFVFAGAAFAASSSDARNLEGLWQPQRFASLVQSAVGTSGVLKTVDGELPPYTAEAQNQLWHRIDMEQRGTPVANTQDTCRPRLPYAVLNLFLGPFEILQAPDKIVFFFEADGDMPWTIYLHRDHPGKLKPTYLGDSVAHWEEATLVVDSTGFNRRTWLDGQGSPHSERAHFVMRLDRNGEQLRFHITLDDPVMYTRPWSYEYRAEARPGAKLYEVHCLENIRPENNTNIVYETLTPPPGIFGSGVIEH